jgi:hypothetical protein
MDTWQMIGTGLVITAVVLLIIWLVKDDKNCDADEVGNAKKFTNGNIKGDYLLSFTNNSPTSVFPIAFGSTAMFRIDGDKLVWAIDSNSGGLKNTTDTSATDPITGLTTGGAFPDNGLAQFHPFTAALGKAKVCDGKLCIRTITFSLNELDFNVTIPQPHKKGTATRVDYTLEMDADGKITGSYVGHTFDVVVSNSVSRDLALILEDIAVAPSNPVVNGGFSGPLSAVIIELFDYDALFFQPPQ